MNTSIVSVQHVSKTYGTKKVLDDVCIEVPQGSIYGLLGPNGAGKTTLIRIINQITGPDEGTVLFKGEPLNNSHIFQVGYLPEERGLYKKMEIFDQLMYFARLKGLGNNEAAKRINNWFEKFDIASWKKKKIEDLSKGMQQKVQFIATVLHNPELLILDEPFTGLDPVNADLIRDEIIALKNKGTSIIFSTHRMESVESLCDAIALLNLSKKVLDGKTADIKKQYASNIFEVSLEAQDNPVELPAPFEIKQQNTFERVTHLEVSMPRDHTNVFLQTLLPKCTVLSFQEKIPSINDIFKMKVAETGGALSH